MLAINNGHDVVVRTLLSSGANVNQALVRSGDDVWARRVVMVMLTARHESCWV